MVTLACEQAGAPAPKLSVMPDFVLRIGGLFNPTVRELPEMAYQVRKPFILDSSAAQRTFGLTPTSTDVALRETVEHITASRAPAR